MHLDILKASRIESCEYLRVLRYNLGARISANFTRPFDGEHKT